MSKTQKNWGNLTKIANIGRELFHTFWTTWGNSMNFSGKMCFKIILKVSKNRVLTHSLEDAFFEKPEGGVNLTPPPASILGLNPIFINLFFTTKDNSFPL